eukprot:634804-Rhodomonas_salina.1
MGTPRVPGTRVLREYPGTSDSRNVLFCDCDLTFFANRGCFDSVRTGYPGTYQQFLYWVVGFPMSIPGTWVPGVPGYPGYP